MTVPMGYDSEAIRNALHLVDHASLRHELPSDYLAPYHDKTLGQPGHSARAALGHVMHCVGLALSASCSLEGD